MDPRTSPRSFKLLVVSLPVLCLAQYAASALARAPDSVVRIRAPNEMALTARKACDAAAGCRAPTKIGYAGLDTFARSVNPIAAAAAVAGRDPSAVPQVTLLLQRDLFTRGGRVSPAEVFARAVQRETPTERTAKAPDWAAQLRAARLGTVVERD